MIENNIGVRTRQRIHQPVGYYCVLEVPFVPECVDREALYASEQLVRTRNVLLVVNNPRKMQTESHEVRLGKVRSDQLHAPFDVIDVHVAGCVSSVPGWSWYEQDAARLPPILGEPLGNSVG